MKNELTLYLWIRTIRPAKRDFFFCESELQAQSRVFRLLKRLFRRTKISRRFFAENHFKIEIKEEKMKIEIKEENRQTYSFQIDSESLVRIILFLSFHSNYSKSFCSYSCRHIRKKNGPSFFQTEFLPKSELTVFCGALSVKFLI